MNLFDLSGKIAVVNGASRGIGEAIAKGLADCGALVVLTSRRQDGVQKVADEIVESGGKAVKPTGSGCSRFYLARIFLRLGCVAGSLHAVVFEAA